VHVDVELWQLSIREGASDVDGGGYLMEGKKFCRGPEGN
jgi:hypothetical protein